jgi:Galactose oxidase, central domain
MVTLGGDQGLLFGGEDGAGYDGEARVYDLSVNTWTNQSPATTPSARAFHEMAYLGGDQVLLFGGGDVSGDTFRIWLGQRGWSKDRASGQCKDCPGGRCAWASFLLYSGG